ncbi:MAG: hypothetical protein HUU49_04710 [Candidatus Buchananbacteria bacterium]|nr:hypothetical protein [Candidatus Buchananbacteria bacterium]
MSEEDRGFAGSTSAKMAIMPTSHTLAELIYGQTVRPKGLPGRKCSGCGCVLSIYNTGNRCHGCQKK